MLDKDYLALQKEGLKDNLADGSQLYEEMMREIVIPEIEKEVNGGEQFTSLRQIYNSMILAVWYKQNLKKSLLGDIFINRNKSEGISVDDPKENQKIYDDYLAAFKNGAFDLIKEEYDEGGGADSKSGGYTEGFFRCSGDAYRRHRTEDGYGYRRTPYHEQGNARPDIWSGRYPRHSGRK
jgi:hypothetical protein